MATVETTISLPLHAGSDANLLDKIKVRYDDVQFDPLDGNVLDAGPIEIQCSDKEWRELPRLEHPFLYRLAYDALEKADWDAAFRWSLNERECDRADERRALRIEWEAAQ